ncbi:hypothetical protein VOLCADRAFT_89925 [Volvox carteri f. nagariensis]|uniref:Uncharacterized protein n=1 Tax=Volvox carteri f. nagariensis TaxID=3068 RepID=D8TT09_VOLCA|nr:uncharacterized protein VOLCADRAFT_89925 [Volvox carteri f. nagariensis]EFJ49573.1 hypothetical protein VOLCADRAFT_89925 [Volvox carteri f. nagariensis]|eukprot:XP_002949554.1 hypothetical protein VOLCADRAFT_89925 [Volvox carteri f. nagariensis]
MMNTNQLRLCSPAASASAFYLRFFPASNAPLVAGTYQRRPTNIANNDNNKYTNPHAGHGTAGAASGDSALRAPDDWPAAAAEALVSGPLRQPLSGGTKSAAERMPYAASEGFEGGGSDPGMYDRQSISRSDIGATSGATDDWTDRAAEAAVQYGGGGSAAGAAQPGPASSSNDSAAVAAAHRAQSASYGAVDKTLDAAATVAAKASYIGIATGGKAAAAAAEATHAVGDAAGAAAERVVGTAQRLGRAAADAVEVAGEYASSAGLRAEAALQGVEAEALERARRIRAAMRAKAHRTADGLADAVMAVEGEHGGEVEEKDAGGGSGRSNSVSGAGVESGCSE